MSGGRSRVATGVEARLGLPNIELLHRSYDAALRGFLRSLGADSHEVDELVQQTWMKTCRSIGTFAGRSRVSTWLHSIARHEYLNYRDARSCRFRRELSTPVDQIELAAPSRNAAVLDDHVRTAVSQLPPRQREILICRYWYGMTCPEVARRMGVTSGTIKSQTFKALRSLRVVLGAGGGES